MNRFELFVNEDYRARKRALAVSGACCFLAGVLLESSGYPFEQSAKISVALLAVVFLMQVIVYCRQSKVARAVTDRRVRPTVTRRLAFGVGSAGLIAAINFLPVNTLTAAVLDRRIRSAFKNRPLNPNSLETLVSEFGVATELQVVLPRSTRAIASTALIETASVSDSDLAALRDLANALRLYSSKLDPPSITSPPSTEAERALLRLVGQIREFDSPLIPTDQIDNVIGQLTLCIGLAADEPGIMREALCYRAALYNRIQRYDLALADANQALEFGAPPSSVLSLNITSLVGRRRANDLERAIRLANLAILLDPPKWVLAIDPGMSRLYRFEILRRRMSANYLLRRFRAVLEDRDPVLSLDVRIESVNEYVHGMAVASALWLNDYDLAKRLTEEWVRTDDSEFAAIVKELLANGTPSQKVLDLIHGRLMTSI